MNKRIARIIVFCLLLATVLTGCGSSKLVGQWKEVPDEGCYLFSEIEFFSDGTYVSDSANYDGTYSTDGDRLRISGILVSDRTFTFKVEGDILYLETSDAKYKYKKAD